ncbi:MAG: 4Fe-4S binding protein [Eubacteriales bacterium]
MQLKKNQIDNENLKLVVKTNKCPQNHPCPSVRVCPTDALSQKGYSAPVVDLEKCIKCGKCVKFCPKGALVLE